MAVIMEGMDITAAAMAMAAIQATLMIIRTPISRLFLIEFGIGGSEL